MLPLLLLTFFVIVVIPAVFWLYCLKVAWMNKAIELQAELDRLKRLNPQETRDMLAALDRYRADLNRLAAGSAEYHQ